VSHTNDYVIRVLQDPTELPAEAWDALVAASARPSPFMRYAYLSALLSSGSASPATGWAARFVTLWCASSQQLLAACPLYLKSHSYGEYVFDWSWAQAYEHHGLDYYPKGLIAVPFTPVPGTRLLAHSPEARRALVQTLETLATDWGLSSLHLLFPDASEHEALQAAGWLPRDGVQFHFHNQRPDGLPYQDLDDMLRHMQQEKRKKVRQERRKVQDAGVRCTCRVGRDIRAQDWDFFYRCYERTYLEHGNPPYLTSTFFDAMASTMADDWMMVLAHRGDTPIAASLIGLDRASRVAYGRYWGCTEAVDCLHFELCYYQPLSWCIDQGYQRFEGGAQGVHKMARGLLPAPTRSWHWIADPQFRDAIGRFVVRESQGMAMHREELERHSPMKTPPEH
jgi:uncharacterized protein